MIEAWLAVERELEALAEESGIDLAERKWTAPALAEELVKRDLIEASALPSKRKPRSITLGVQPAPPPRWIHPPDDAEARGTRAGARAALVSQGPRGGLKRVNGDRAGYGNASSRRAANTAPSRESST